MSTASSTSNSSTESVEFREIRLEFLKEIDVHGMRRCVRMGDKEFVGFLHSLGILLDESLAHLRNPSVDVLYWLERDPVMKPKQIFLLSYLWALGHHQMKPLDQLLPVHGANGDIVDVDHISTWIRRFSAICRQWKSKMTSEFRARGEVKKYATEFLWRSFFGEECFYHLWAQILYFSRN